MHIPRKSYAAAGIGSLTSRLTGAGLDAKAAKAIGDVLGQVLRQQNFDERLNYEAIERGTKPSFKFHFRGALTVSTSNDDLITASSSSLIVWGRLTTAGTTTTTAVVKLDGTTVVTLTFASGVKNALPATYAVATVAGSALAAGVTVVGTGAAGLVVGAVPA